jgi:hypothetical protein
MTPITNAQISKFHVLLSQLKLQESKADFVSQFSNGRATSTKDLSMQEAGTMLKFLSQFDPCDKMRRKVFALAYESGIIYGHTPEDKKMNDVKLNNFLKERGAVKKGLNKMNKGELVKTVNQFEQIIKHNELNKAGKTTKNLLAELNIKTSKKST